MTMRQFNLKQGWLAPNPYNDDPAPGGADFKAPSGRQDRWNVRGGRTVYPEPMREAEPGWARQAWEQGERVVRREGDVEKGERDAAREWLGHVEAGRIG